MTVHHRIRDALAKIKKALPKALFEEVSEVFSKLTPRNHGELFYPRTSKDAKDKAVQVALFDVRAADDLRVTYDFDRDGWVIWQASVFKWVSEDEECDPKWKEAAFCRAWQFEEEKL